MDTYKQPTSSTEIQLTMTRGCGSVDCLLSSSMRTVSSSLSMRATSGLTHFQQCSGSLTKPLWREALEWNKNHLTLLSTRVWSLLVMSISSMGTSSTSSLILIKRHTCKRSSWMMRTRMSWMNKYSSSTSCFKMLQTRSLSRGYNLVCLSSKPTLLLSSKRSTSLLNLRALFARWWMHWNW